MLFAVLAPFALPDSVYAAACANVSSFGAVTVHLPTLEHIKDRVIWIRMQSPEDSVRVLAEVSAKDCLEISGQSQPTNTWQWQTVRDSGGTAVPYSFGQHDDNTIKIIGVQPGVRVDRMLITDTKCVPQDFGNNCQAVGAKLATAEEHDYTVLPSPNSSPLHGKVQLSDTPTQNQGNLKEVTYSVAGTVVQQSAYGLVFDTSRLQNGTHTVYITTTLQDETQIREMVVVTIKNPHNPLTPLVRWAKLNQQALKTAGVITLGLLAGIILIRVVLIRLRKRRVRIFHGL